MSEHIMTTRLTAEDFKNAMFAVLPKYGLRAHKSAGNAYWQRDGINRATDAEMAEAGWRPVRESAPLTLDTLREAWENADRLSGCKPGDTLIAQLDPDVDAFTVYRADYSVNAQELPDTIRVAGRAPEPWQGLGDKLAVEMPGIEDEPRIEALAKALYCEHGVRVVGDDDRG